MDIDSTKKEVLNTFTQGLKILEKNPSATIEVMKDIAKTGGGVFNVLGGLSAFTEIKDVYDGWNETHSNADRARDILRILASVAKITFSGMAAAVAFGATVIAAPVITLVLSSITLVRNSLDLMTEIKNNGVIKDQIKNLDADLKKSDVEVSRNMDLLKDLADSQAEINNLAQKQIKLKSKLEQLEKEPSKPEQPNANDTLKNKIQTKLLEIDNSLKDKRPLLDEKMKQTKLFLPELLKNDGAALKALENKSDKILERADLEHKKELNAIARNKRKKNIVLGLAGLGLAIAACIPPAQALLGVAVVAVAVVAAVSTIKDYLNKRNAVEKHKSKVVELNTTLKTKHNADTSMIKGFLDTLHHNPHGPEATTQQATKKEEVHASLLEQRASTVQFSATNSSEKPLLSTEKNPTTDASANLGTPSIRKNSI